MGSLNNEYAYKHVPRKFYIHGHQFMCTQPWQDEGGWWACGHGHKKAKSYCERQCDHRQCIAALYCGFKLFQVLCSPLYINGWLSCGASNQYGLEKQNGPQCCSPGSSNGCSLNETNEENLSHPEREREWRIQK